MIRRWWIAGLLLALAGCAPLKPWERGDLLRKCMQPSYDPLESSMDGHMHATRESAQGAAGVGGPSCGCN